jgi:hypothetical protein
MAMVSEAIQSSCRRAAGATGAWSSTTASSVGDRRPIQGLFELSAAGTATLVRQGQVCFVTLASFGRTLDSIWDGQVAAGDIERLYRHATTSLEILAPGSARTALLDIFQQVWTAADATADPATSGMISAGN